MHYYFYGEDAYRARQAVDKLAARHQAKVRWLDRLDFEEKSAGEVLGSGSQGLFGRELTVVRDAGSFPAGLQEDVLAALEGVASALCVLWDRGKPDKHSVFYRRLKERGRQFVLWPSAQAARWVEEEAARRGGHINTQAARQLVERVGTDGWRLSNELDKLLVSGERITARMLDDQVPEAAEAEIFSMLEALSRGEGGRALKSTEILLAAGNSEFYIMSMLAYQFRTLLAIRKGIDRGLSQEAIAKRHGLKPYPVRKNYSYARRRPAAYWRAALTRVLAADFSIKQGKTDPRTGLLMLMLNVTGNQ